MSDRIAVMNEGRVEQIGTPQEIYHSPTSVFVANFIGVANLIPAVVTRSRRRRTPRSWWPAAHRGPGARAAASGCAPGAAATIMVRPERLRLDATRRRPTARACR